MVRRNKNGTKRDEPKPQAVTSTSMIRRVCREHWDAFLRPDGALNEDAHHEHVFGLLLGDPAFVVVRRAEDLTILHRDITKTIRDIRSESHPSASDIIARGQTGESKQPIQMSLRFDDFFREKYEVPITGETKAGTDLLLREGKAVLQDHQLKVAIFTIKANRLAAVVREAERKGLRDDDKLGKVWAV